MLLTRVHDRILPTGLAQLIDNTTSGKLQRAAHAYQHAIDDLTQTGRTRSLTKEAKLDSIIPTSSNLAL